MSEYLDTTGNNLLSIAICARCGMKFASDDLQSDPNYPSLRVCREDLDDYDPYRLPPRNVEDVTLEWPRPDFTLQTQTVVPASQDWVDVAPGPYPYPRPTTGFPLAGDPGGGQQVITGDTGKPMESSQGQGAGAQEPITGNDS